MVHFHPGKKSNYEVMIEGKNELGVKVVNERLLGIFKKHNLC